jgi:hypothetical protein
MTYSGNVGKKCSSSDVAVSPVASCAPPACPSRSIAPMGWVDSVGYDFHLKSDSPAVGAADPAYATARDRDNKLRDTDPDAGAYEYGVGGSKRAPQSAIWRLGGASLKPKVICRKARKGCPSTTKLRMRLGRQARVSVRVLRVRKGADKLTRTRKLPKVTIHRATRLSAHGLKAGRYRVRVRAGDAAGRWSRPVFLKLRVR